MSTEDRGRERGESVADLRATLADPQYPSDSVTACVSTVDLERVLDALASASTEAAERDDERRGDLGNALGWELDESPSWAAIMRGIADLRALAALKDDLSDPLPDEVVETETCRLCRCSVDAHKRDCPHWIEPGYPDYATIRVEDGMFTSFPLVGRVRGGWQSGAHHYPDSVVSEIRPMRFVYAERSGGER